MTADDRTGDTRGDRNMRRVSLDQLVELIPRDPVGSHRFVVALAGPPAAGKSTLAAALHAAIGDRAGLLQMDAFHYDNAILEERGHRPRKGAPHTFDVAAYRLQLSGLRNDPTLSMSVPRFDRSLELSRNCAAIIKPDQHVLITEGNYLLLDGDPWATLPPLFDLTVWVDAPLDVIEARIMDRWRQHGLSEADARQRAESNDLPNARLIVERSAPATVTHDAAGSV